MPLRMPSFQPRCDPCLVVPYLTTPFGFTSDQFNEIPTPPLSDAPGDDAYPYTVYGEFSMDLTAFNAVLFGFFIAAVVVAGLVFILRYMNWNGRNSRSVLQAVNTATVGGVNCSVLVSMALTAMHTWNWFFFPFVLILTWFLFLFFKIQSAPALFLPLQVRVAP